MIFFFKFLWNPSGFSVTKGKMDGGKERREMQKKDVRFSFCVGIIFNGVEKRQHNF